MATRDYNFIVGPETSTLPTATNPTANEDFLSKGYADSTYAPIAAAAPSPERFILNGLIDDLYLKIDGILPITESKNATKISISAKNSGSGTTTVQITRGGTSGAATRTASLVGDGLQKITTTSIASLSLQDGDYLYCDLTAIGSGVDSLQIKLVYS